MPRKIRDTNILLNWWRDKIDGRVLADINEKEVQIWVSELLRDRPGGVIVPPVQLRFL